MRSHLPCHARIEEPIDITRAGGAESAAAEGGRLISLLRVQKKVSFAPRQIVFHEGDPADSVFLVVSGTLCLYRFLPNGRRLIARFLFPGDIVGLSSEDENPFTAECITPAIAYKLAHSDLRPLCAHSPSLQNDVALLLARELISAREDHYPMMHQAAHARVARLLRMIARRNGGDCRNGKPIQLSMTRSDIADYLGVTIETVCRSFMKLKKDGLISASSPDQIWIEDGDRLMSLADDEK